MDARRGPETVIKEHVMPALRDTYQDLLRPATQADLLVSHVLTYAIPILAEKLCKPWASTVLSPMVFFSAHDVPVLAPLPMLAKLRVLGPGFNAWFFRQLKKVSHSWSRPVAELRRELGLPAGRDPLWEGQHSPHLVLAMFSPRFGPPQPDWPANVQVTGFPFLDAPDEPLDAGLEPFVSGGERPIVYTDEFVSCERVVDAFAQADLHVAVDHHFYGCATSLVETKRRLHETSSPSRNPRPGMVSSRDSGRGDGLPSVRHRKNKTLRGHGSNSRRRAPANRDAASSRPMLRRRRTLAMAVPCSRRAGCEAFGLPHGQVPKRRRAVYVQPGGRPDHPLPSPAGGRDATSR
jgi:hypothetical protein